MGASNLIETEDRGIIFVEFNSVSNKGSIEYLFSHFSNPKNKSSSVKAKELLATTSPARRIASKSQHKMVLVAGFLIKKDPKTEEVRRFAKNKNWLIPSVEDALRLFSSLSECDFDSDRKRIVVMHEPVNGYVLGASIQEERMIMTTHKAEPIKGWFCADGYFAFCQ